MLRYLLAAALATPALAISAATTLRTTQSQYCVPPTDIFVDSFSATYHKSNQSIVFYISLDTTQSNADVSARALVSAYGMELVNQEIDLCELIGGVLCPLPSLNISTYGTYQLSDIDIPDLAWTVPDLEAYARIELVRSNGTDALCIEAPLTNGLTAGHPAVGIATGAFTGVALLVGLFHSMANTASPAQYRWFDILFLYQYAVGLGLLNLDYPTVWRSFSKQLFWSHALFHSDRMQDTIDSMRYKTGGSRSGSIVNNAYFIPSPEDKSGFSNFNTIISRLQALASALTGGGLTGLFKRATLPYGESAITSSLIANQEDLVQTNGLPVYTNSIDIPYTNALTTIFFFFLAFIGIFLAVHAIVFLVTLLVARGKHFGAIDFKRRFGLWTAGNLLLLCLMWFLPLWTFGFYQFRIGDSKLAIFWAVLGLVLTFVPLAAVFLLSILRHRRYSSTSPGVSPLYTSYKWFHSAGHVYRAYRPRFHWFWFVLVLAMIARAGFIAFGPANGWAQVIGLMVTELIVLIALIACRPHKDKKGDWLAPILSFCRLAMAGLLIAFIPSVGVAGIPKAVIGFVLIAIVGILTVLLFIGLIFNAGYGWLWRRHTDRVEDGFEVERDRYISSDGRTLGARGEHMRENKRMTHVDSAADSNRTSADLMGANNAYAGAGAGAGAAAYGNGNEYDSTRGNRRSSIMDPVGDNVYDTTGYNGNGGVADHNAYVRDGREAEYGYGNGQGSMADSRPGSGLGHTPSYRRSQYGGSTRGSTRFSNGNGAGVGAGRY